MQLHKTLYSKSKLGQSIQWEIYVDGDSFFTREGMVGGTITESLPTKCLITNAGKKNERSPEQQAIFEANAKYTKKLKSGYSEDLSLAGKKSFIEPMTAKSLKDYPEVIERNFDNLIIQQKKNGMRAVLTKDDFKSRRGEVILSAPHIPEAFKALFEAVPSSVVDFELNNESLRECLNELMKIVRKTVDISPEMIARSKEIVEAHVYDYYSDELPESVPYWKRMEKFASLLNLCGPSVKLVESYEVTSKADIEKIFIDYVSNGGEGIMIRHKDMPYEHKRSKKLIKMKPDDDDECEIIEIHEGKGNWAGYAMTATIKWEDKTFDATLVGNQEERKNVLLNPHKWVGTRPTFTYMGKTGLGVPCYARIKLNNCFNDKSKKGVIE